MAPTCNLIIDSCCELPKRFVDKPGIMLLNYEYTLNGDSIQDDMYENSTPHEFYEAMRTGAEPQTSQLPMARLKQAFEAALGSGMPSVFLSFSGALTGTLETARLVYSQLVEDLKPEHEILIFDTKLASTAQALFVHEAIQQWEKGLSAQALFEWAQQAAPYVNEMFVVDDLEALKRGGRIPAAVATIGSKLDVKPLLDIDVNDGSLRSCGLVRGKKKAIKQMVALFTKLIPEKDRDGRLVLIGDADAPEDAKRLEDLLRKTAPGIQVLHLSIGPVIGSHVGPGMLSLSFWGPDSR